MLPVLMRFERSMSSLRVQILAGEARIGAATLIPSDPSMGVAFAVFEPGPDYVADRHARATEQREFMEDPAALKVCDAEGAVLVCAGVDLVDYSETLGEEGREIHVIGIERFEDYFD